MTSTLTVGSICIVQGLKSQPSFNSHKVRIIEWLPNGGKFVISPVDANTPRPSLLVVKPENLRPSEASEPADVYKPPLQKYKAGTRLVLKGLRSQPQFNGHHVVSTGYLFDQGRYKVTPTESSSPLPTTLAIKPENLSPVVKQQSRPVVARYGCIQRSCSLRGPSLLPTCQEDSESILSTDDSEDDSCSDLDDKDDDFHRRPVSRASNSTMSAGPPVREQGSSHSLRSSPSDHGISARSPDRKQGSDHSLRSSSHSVSSSRSLSKKGSSTTLITQNDDDSDSDLSSTCELSECSGSNNSGKQSRATLELMEILTEK